MIKYNDLRTADLITDEVYEGGTKNKNIKDEVLSKLLGMDNSGGIRKRGNLNPFDVKYVTLFITLMEVDWPDKIDFDTGILTYYGDNRVPGRQLHDTHKKGNQLFREVFNRLYLGSRYQIPPFFVFEKGGKGRDLIFRGVAVPGSEHLGESEDLIAIWSTKDSSRYQNYKAMFSILDIPIVKRKWIDDLLEGNPLSSSCPDAYRNWVESGIYSNLLHRSSLITGKSCQGLKQKKIF